MVIMQKELPDQCCTNCAITFGKICQTAEYADLTNNL